MDGSLRLVALDYLSFREVEPLQLYLPSVGCLDLGLDLKLCSHLDMLGSLSTSWYVISIRHLLCRSTIHGFFLYYWCLRYRFLYLFVIALQLGYGSALVERYRWILAVKLNDLVERFLRCCSKGRIGGHIHSFTP